MEQESHVDGMVSRQEQAVQQQAAAASSGHAGTADAAYPNDDSATFEGGTSPKTTRSTNAYMMELSKKQGKFNGGVTLNRVLYDKWFEIASAFVPNTKPGQGNNPHRDVKAMIEEANALHRTQLDTFPCLTKSISLNHLRLKRVRVEKNEGKQHLILDYGNPRRILPLEELNKYAQDFIDKNGEGSTWDLFKEYCAATIAIDPNALGHLLPENPVSDKGKTRKTGTKRPREPSSNQGTGAPTDGMEHFWSNQGTGATIDGRELPEDRKQPAQDPAPASRVGGVVAGLGLPSGRTSGTATQQNPLNVHGSTLASPIMQMTDASSIGHVNSYAGSHNRITQNEYHFDNMTPSEFQAAIASTVAPFTQAQEDRVQSVEEENRQLRARVQSVEEENRQLRARVQSVEEENRQLRARGPSFEQPDAINFLGSRLSSSYRPSPPRGQNPLPNQQESPAPSLPDIEGDWASLAMGSAQWRLHRRSPRQGRNALPNQQESPVPGPLELERGSSSQSISSSQWVDQLGV